jgi:Fimbrial assembly protein (PilN)
MRLGKKLDVEFIKANPFALSSYSWLSLMVLLASIILATFVWQKYQTQHAELTAINNQLNQSNQQPVPKKTVLETTPTVISADKKIQIQTIVTALVMPWHKLLQAIERADNKDIALLNLTPNTKNQQLILSGEGKDLQAVLRYVSQLQAQPMLDKVYLQKHSIDNSNVSKPVKFTIFTQWRDTES